jgi:hypothetical protein
MWPGYSTDYQLSRLEMTIDSIGFYSRIDWWKLCTTKSLTKWGAISTQRTDCLSLPQNGLLNTEERKGKSHIVGVSFLLTVVHCLFNLSKIQCAPRMASYLIFSTSCHSLKNTSMHCHCLVIHVTTCTFILTYFMYTFIFACIQMQSG